MDMKKRSFKKLITLSLTLAMLTGVAGCGKQQSLNAETNPDTPVSDVQFPLKEKAELSFIKTHNGGICDSFYENFCNKKRGRHYFSKCLFLHFLIMQKIIAISFFLFYNKEKEQSPTRG